MRALIALAAACSTGCYGVDGIDGTWEPVAITGPLAAELGPPPAPRQPPATLRIASWNVHFAAAPEALAAALRADPAMAEADVLLLQEIEAHPGEPRSRTARLAAALAMTWVYVPARLEGDGTHGLAIASRFPLANLRVMQLPHADSAWHERARIAVAADVVLGVRTLPIVNVHLDVRIGPTDRVRQLHPAVIALPPAVAVGGDFNTNPWAWVGSAVPLTGTQAIVGQDQAAVLDDYLDALGFTAPIAPDEPTFDAPLVGGRLDNVYARGLAVGAAGVASAVAGSDHWPVWVDIAPP